MNKDLFPCPFCGGEPRVMHCGAATYMIQCVGCKVTTDDGGLNRIADLWNHRPRAPKPDVGLDGVSLIAAERRRQIEEEGWTAEHDDASYHDGELQRAAAAYVLSGMKIYRIPISIARSMKRIIAGIWPWDEAWFKPVSSIPSVEKYGVGARVRTLVKAGALIAAEIDQQLRRRAETSGIGTAEIPAPVSNLRVDPDYCFDPAEWEFTCDWSDRDQVHGHGDGLNRSEPMRVCTLMKGPDKWVADVPVTWDEHGDPDETEIKWFDSEEEARAALATTEGSQP